MFFLYWLMIVMRNVLPRVADCLIMTTIWWSIPEHVLEWRASGMRRIALTVALLLAAMNVAFAWGSSGHAIITNSCPAGQE